MNRILIILLLLILHFKAYGKVIISGKIQNYDGKSTLYYQPIIEGIYTPYWKELKPLSNGNFTIVFESTGIGAMTLGYKGIRYRFLIDTNSKIYLELDQKIINEAKRKTNSDRVLFADSIKQVATIKISGDFEKINQFYNRNLRTSYSTTRSVSGNYYSQLISQSISKEEVSKVIDSLINLELKQIESLPWQLNTENPTVQRKQEEIRLFLTNEVSAFYSAVFLNGMFLKRKKHLTMLLSDSLAKPNIYGQEWEKMIEQLAVDVKNNRSPIPNSPDYNDFMESMLTTMQDYQTYTFPKNSLPLDEIVSKLLFKYDTAFLSDKGSQFAIELSVLHRFLNDQQFYSPALLNAVYELQKKYPKSSNLEFFKPQVEKLKANLENIQKDFENGKIIEANYNSFQNLIKRFEGKNLLIDVWATWCHPCIDDFKNKSIIQPFIETQNLEILYISIDKPEWEDRWRQSIKINQLAGHHFRANSKFIADMWNEIGDFEGAIPRYILIDKFGKIFKSTAARPSMGDELPNQITDLINKIN